MMIKVMTMMTLLFAGLSHQPQKHGS